METQDKSPDVREGLQKVGVKDLRTLVRIRKGGSNYKFVPRIDLTVDLSEKKKGVHLSRLVEAITETVEEEIEQIHESIEELERNILERLKEKHPYKKAEISMETELVVERRTPKTNRRTMETHDIRICAKNENGTYKKELKVKVLGNTVCPHAIKKSGKPHIQRALGVLELKTDYGNKIELEDMISCVEESFSSPVYTLLKTEDETYIVDMMHANPRFVEDVCRGILSSAKSRFKGCQIWVEVISQESIHRHNVVAEGSCRT